MVRVATGGRSQSVSLCIESEAERKTVFRSCTLLAAKLSVELGHREPGAP